MFIDLLLLVLNIFLWDVGLPVFNYCDCGFVVIVMNGVGSLLLELGEPNVTGAVNWS